LYIILFSPGGRNPNKGCSGGARASIEGSMTDKILVLTTCASEEEAKRIARALVERRLAACVNIVPGLRSVYRWRGALEEESECLLVIKSRRDLFDELRAGIESLHSYELPELIALPVVEGSEAYLNWLERELFPGSSD
jgi:periplasmic divalent cation tolerance protein